jgi:hypothetical protein
MGTVKRCLQESPKMSDEQIIKSAIAAVDLYIESLKTSMSPAAEMGGIEELRDLFAISGLTSEDYVLYSVSELIRRVVGWPEQRREGVDKAALQQAAAAITRALENMLAA